MLLSGGSGKRLWPLSNEIRSKLFLKLLPGADGQPESMMQRVCRQLAAAGLLERAVIVTHCSQTEITRRHAGADIPIIEEPLKRGTYAAIALACSFLSAELHVAPDETILVLPVDLFVEPSFFRVLQRLPEALRQAGADIGLIGTPPSHPSSQYGYMVPKRKATSGRRGRAATVPSGADGAAAPDWIGIERFTEKPDPPAAAKLMKQGALWNCGAFAFRLGHMMESLQREGQPTTPAEWADKYAGLPEASFDEQVVERSARRIALVYEGPWHDLGSWETFARHMEERRVGPGHVGEDSPNTHLVNELDRPVYVVGVPDAIVAASPDGILVASKSDSNLVKSLLGEEARMPMYEEKRWGFCRTLDYVETEQGGVLTRRIELQPGGRTSYHSHAGKEEVWTVLFGNGSFILEDKIYTVGPGDVMRFPTGARHGVKADTALLCVQVEIGQVRDETDILRLSTSW
ncbi:sugar phosphate nucleotidyltransferase [Paenibacillus methanolicus]|uniref:sugar phosphate nucleotidyltransferase n=1 Tax=Paenibacillus methanolicus TaxID=582686 RepID=UPI001FECC1B9|nr:sugar phosphate nucleotidyltransferase [Paenibacillus methanolicus]